MTLALLKADDVELDEFELERPRSARNCGGLVTAIDDAYGS